MATSAAPVWLFLSSYAPHLMQQNPKALGIVAFGVFEADLRTGELRKSGVKVKLQEQPFRILAELLARPDELVTRDELRERIWGGETFVDFEHSLNTAVAKLRAALDDSASNPRFVETLPGRGYRFIAAVQAAGDVAGHRRAPGVSGSQRRGSSHAQAPNRIAGSPKLFAVLVVAVFAVVAGVVLWLRRATESTAPDPMKTIAVTAYPGRELHPRFSPKGEKITFIWDQAGNFDVYTKGMGAGDSVRLTDGPSDDFNPVWSPDGRFVAFARNLANGNVGIFRVPAMGGAETPVAEFPGHTYVVGQILEWTPDGRSLIVGDRPGPGPVYGLVLVSVETGERRQLTRPRPGVQNDTCPVMSPDGRSLAFVRFQGAILEADLHLLPLAEDYGPAGDPKRLTFDNLITDRPHWTPDGRFLVYGSFGRYPYLDLWLLPIPKVSDREWIRSFEQMQAFPVNPALSPDGSRLVYVQGRAERNIWRIELGAGRRPLRSEKFIFSSRSEAQAAYTRDGQRIAFASDQSGSWEIWVCDRDGSDPVQLTSMGGVVNGSPKWSPNGKQIAFVSDLDRIYLIDSEGGPPQELTDRAGEPSWSRDGNWIYFGSNRGGEYQVWKMPPQGGEAEQVTRHGGYCADESLDGKYLYYTKRLEEGTSLWRIPLSGGEETQVLDSVYRRHFALTETGIYFIPAPVPASKFLVRFYEFATGSIRTVTELVL